MGIPLSFSQNHQKRRQEGRGDTAVNKAVEQSTYEPLPKVLNREQ